MRRLVVAVCLGVLLGMPGARAEPIPDYVLDKDFANCMGGESPAADPQRQAYCICIRDSMKSWSLEEYGQVATEGAKAHTAGQEPAQLQTIAQQCIAKVLPQ